MASPAPPPQRRCSSNPTSIPIWRDERAVRLVLQLLFVGAVIAVVAYLFRNALRGLDQLGLGFGFGFLQMEAGFGISEGIEYQPSDSYGRAFVVGIVNTVRVALLGILCATLIGTVAGIARLSSNWLLRNIARTYVEVFRNVPLLLQLLFWYGAVLLKLPPVRQAVGLYEYAFLSQRGLYVARPVPTESLSPWLWILAAGFVLGGAVYALHSRHLRRHDRPGFPIVSATVTWIGVALIGWMAVPTHPFALEFPVLGRFNFSGGILLSPEFTGLLLGLSVYTGAFIAEVVRGGIQSVDNGQREAAMALGLRPWQVMYMIVLPQALRIIVPPITSQYLNLAKNSSLAVAIGFPELFNVGTTTMNQTGQTLPVFALIMGCYLGFSLLTSVVMNWYNRRMRLIER